MEIIRKQFNEEGQIISAFVLKENATLKDWNDLQHKMWQKVEYSSYGIPNMTNWKNKSILRTKNGHKFYFEFKK